MTEMPSDCSRLMICKQHLHFVGGKRCRGFVHDQDTRLAIHGARDLDDPLHMMREVAHPGLRRQPLETHALEQRGGPAFKGPAVDAHAGPGQARRS